MVNLHYTNPVYPEYFADPFAWRHDGVYYAIGTGAPQAGTSPSLEDEERVFPILISENFVDWRPAGNALIRPDRSLGDDFWAPEVAFADGKFYLYYSVGHGDKGHHLRVAVSDAPAGPYRDHGVLLDLTVCPFSIDAHAFRDDDGQWYLFYARDFLDHDGGARPGTALVVDRLETMTKLAGEPKTVLRAHHDWQLFEARRPLYGRVWDWHTLEGPCVLKRDGRYYCLYSGGRWEDESYGVDYGVADNVLGPYADAGAENGARILRTVPGHVRGPGHNSVVKGPDGETDYIVYHAWDEGRTARKMCLDKLIWTSDGPRCAGPTWTPQDVAVDCNAG